MREDVKEHDIYCEPKFYMFKFLLKLSSYKRQRRNKNPCNRRPLASHIFGNKISKA